MDGWIKWESESCFMGVTGSAQVRTKFGECEAIIGHLHAYQHTP